MIFLMILSSRRAVVRLDGAPVHEDVEDAELSQMILRLPCARCAASGGPTQADAGESATR